MLQLLCQIAGMPAYRPSTGPNAGDLAFTANLLAWNLLVATDLPTTPDIDETMTSYVRS